MASNEEFCTNYMVLNSKEVTLFQLIRILFLHDFRKINCIEFSESPEKLSGFRSRWLIFISILVQKILHLLKDPLARIGALIEFLLNLPSRKGGKVDTLSATFRSVVGNLDKRVELDKSIKTDDSRYNASLSIMAAKLSYENEAFARSVVTDQWKMKFLGFYKCYNDYEELYTTEAIMFQDKITDPDLIVVAFRGTQPFSADDWSTDVDLSWYELKYMGQAQAQAQAQDKVITVGKAHGGFMKALGLQKTTGWPKEIKQEAQYPYAYYKVREELRILLKANDKAKFMVCGHSLGGALAILFAGVLALHEDEEAWLLKRLEGVYTFGQPRVGDALFGEFMKEKLRMYDVKYRRYVYGNDVVPRLPFDDKIMFFKHFGSCLYYDGLYHGQELEEEPNKNYFSILWVAPKVLNALWELIRSIIIPYTRGLEYKEGWFFRIIRVVGLVIPGISAHCPQDYVNLTRIGTIFSSLHLRDETSQQDEKLD